MTEILYPLRFNLKYSSAFAPFKDVITELYWSKNQYYECKIGQLLRHFQMIGNIDCYVDIGAHWGNHAMFMNKLSKEMHLFEADPFNFSILKINCPSANLYNCAIGHKSKLVDTIQEAENNTGSRYISGNGPIQMHTLDSFDLKPSIIKIDVEGYERKVLLGAKETINKYRPIVSVEVENDEASINEFFTKRGYSIVSTKNKSATNIYFP